MRVVIYSPVPGSGRWYQDRTIMHALRALNHEVALVERPAGLTQRPAELLLVRLDMGEVTPPLIEAVIGMKRAGATVAAWVGLKPITGLVGWPDVILTTMTRGGWGLYYESWDEDRVVRLRHGCDFSGFGRKVEKTVADVAYCGRNTEDKVRLRTWVEPLLTRFRSAVTGGGWRERGIPSDEVRPERESGIYRSARIALAVHELSERGPYSDIAQRVYDAVACGVPVIADDHPALADAFGSTVRTARSPREYAELVREILADGRAELAAADAAWRRGRSLHNIVDIVRVALSEIEREMAR